jgi:hypothetical protein
MQLKYSQFLAALRQAQTFLDTNTAVLGTINASGMRRDLDAAATQLEALGETQGSHLTQARGERTNELRLARSLRRQHIRPIVRIARAKLPEVAQLSAMSLPPLKTNSTALATQAGAIGDAVQPHVQVFVDAGLPADFIARMRSAADQLVQSIGGKGSHRSQRIKATTALDQEVQQAKRVVAVLDGLVRAQLDEQEPLVSEWRAASRAISGGGSPANPPIVVLQPAAPAVPVTAPIAARPQGVPAA